MQSVVILFRMSEELEQIVLVMLILLVFVTVMVALGVALSEGHKLFCTISRHECFIPLTNLFGSRQRIAAI